jgi:hypothetical protein
MAMSRFESRQYEAALRLFRSVYDRQIAKLAEGGKKQVVGILGISPQFRAEVLFLVEWDRLRRLAGGSAESLRDGLVDLQAAIEAGVGPWAIISEAEKGRIRRHVENLGQ